MKVNKELRKTLNNLQLIATIDYLNKIKPRKSVVIIADNVLLQIINTPTYYNSNTVAHLEAIKAHREIKLLVGGAEVLKMKHGFRNIPMNDFSSRKLKAQYLSRAIDCPLYKLGYFFSLRVVQKTELSESVINAIKNKLLSDLEKIASVMKQIEIEKEETQKSLTKKR